MHKEVHATSRNKIGTQNPRDLQRDQMQRAHVVYLLRAELEMNQSFKVQTLNFSWIQPPVCQSAHDQ